MNYDIHVKHLPPEHVMTKRTHTTLAKLGDAMSAALDAVPKGAARGAPFAIYHNEPFRPEDVDVELGVPIAAGANASSPAGGIRDLSGGPVAYTVHVGPYAAIGAAYEALYGWLARHGLHASGPPREIYWVGPQSGKKTDEYRTEIDVPIDGSSDAFGEL